MIYENDTSVPSNHKMKLTDRKIKLAEDFDHIRFLITNNILDEAKTNLLKMHYADVADFLDNTNHKYYQVILPVLADELEPETIVSLSDSAKQPALEAIGIDKSYRLINNLDLEDAIEVIESLDDNFKEQILSGIDSEKRIQILEGFKYPENTVGRVLEKDFIVFHQHWTVAQASDYLRRSKIDYDFHAAIVVDSRYRPVGNILLSTLLKNPRNTAISQLMNSELKIADAFTNVNELAFVFKQYALTIVPVINKTGKLIGSVSIDNMLYIIEEQAETKLLQLGGVNSVDTFDNLFETVKHRFPWLFVNLLTSCITSVIIEKFSSTIATLVTLAAVMPIVAAVSGNVGMQVMTVTVRALTNHEINQSNTSKMILKELIVSCMNGSLVAIVGSVLTYILFRNFDISIIFTIAVFLNFIVAGLLGSCVPIIMNRLGMDPAIASGVFVSAFTDALGFFGFLGLAFVLLV